MNGYSAKFCFQFNQMYYFVLSIKNIIPILMQNGFLRSLKQTMGEHNT